MTVQTSVWNPSSFFSRLVGALALEAGVYEDVERDTGATGQAIAVVLLSSVAAGIGARGFGGGRAVDLLFVGAVALLAWAAWALVVYTVGALLLPEPQTRADIGELLRTTGFATAPGFIQVLGVVPGLAPLVFTVAAVWLLFTMIVAVRQALEFTTTRRAVAVCVVGWLLALGIAGVYGFFFGPRLA